MLLHKASFAAIFLCLSFPFAAISAMKLVSYPTHFYTHDASDAGNVKIKAGRTANSNLCSNEGTNPCDSCAQLSTIDSAGNSVVCNTAEVYPALNFPVVFKSDTTALFTGSPSVKAVINSTAVTLSSYSGTIAAGQEITANIAWSNICAAATSDSSCSTSFNVTLLVGINTDGTNTLTESVRFTIAYRYVSQSPYQTWGCGVSMNAWEGFCDFYLYPGDSKAYVVDPGLNGASKFVTGNMNTVPAPSSSDPSLITYKALRMFYIGGTSPITYAGYGAQFTPHTDHQDLFLDVNNAKLTNGKVAGLSNNLQYLFVSANVDEAGNVSHFSQIASLSDVTTAPYGSSQSVIPEPVYGLLDSNKCFIATAAFGSELAPEVQTFRDFRDAFMVTNRLGHFLMGTYYKYSPLAAEFIANNSLLKASAKWALVPVLVIVKLSLKIGMLPAFILSVLLTAFGAFSIKMLLAKFRRSKKVG